MSACHEGKCDRHESECRLARHNPSLALVDYGFMTPNVSFVMHHIQGVDRSRHPDVFDARGCCALYTLCRIVSESSLSFQVTVMNLLIGVLCEADPAFRRPSFCVQRYDICSGALSHRDCPAALLRGRSFSSERLFHDSI